MSTAVWGSDIANLGMELARDNKHKTSHGGSFVTGARGVCLGKDHLGHCS